MSHAMTKPDLRDPEHWLPRELFAVYCGGGSGKLLAFYDEAKRKRQMLGMHFDAFSFLALPMWLGYRRQWNLLATLVSVLLAFGVIEALTSLRIPHGAMAGAMGGLGLLGYGLLLSNANGLYWKLKRQGLNAEAIERAMADRAKPSVGRACAVLVVGLGVSFALAQLLP